jgi:hypothetical protein
LMENWYCSRISTTLKRSMPLSLSRKRIRTSITRRCALNSGRICHLPRVLQEMLLIPRVGLCVYPSPSSLCHTKGSGQLSKCPSTVTGLPRLLPGTRASPFSHRERLLASPSPMGV